MTEVERMIAVLEANVNKFTKAMDKASGHADRSFNKIERRGKQMEARLANLGRGLSVGKGIFAAVAGSAALQQAQQLIDASTRIQNSLKSAGLEGDELKSVYDKLFTSAQKNAAPIESMVQLYSRLSLVQKELGVDNERLIGFTDKVALALRAGGTSASEASGALLQLSQALGGGVVRAEEFNSIVEGTPAIAQAAAAGLDAAGGSVAKLRQLVVDGKVTSQEFFAAFEAGSSILEGRVAGATTTVSQGFERVNNALIDAAGKLDQATGASRDAAEALKQLAGFIGALSDAFTAAANGPIGGFINRLSEINALIKTIDPFMRAFGAVTDTRFIEGVGRALRGGEKTTPKSGRLAPASFDSRFNGAPLSTGTIYSPDSYASATDGYPMGGDGALEKIGRQSKALGGVRKASDAARNSLVAQKIAVDSLGDSFGESTFDTEAFTEAQRQAGEAAEEFAALAKDVLSGFISDLRQGKTAAEALQNAFDRLIDKLIDSALDAALGALFGLGGGGGLFKLFGFAKGGIAANGRPQPLPRFAGGGVSRTAAIFGEAGPEAAVPLPDGRNIPVKMLGGGGATNVHVTVGVAADGNGNLLPFVQSVTTRALNAAAPGLVKASVGATQAAMRNRPGFAR